MLYLCATPIGNLGDISERVIETLKKADVIAAEDTRQTIKLLNHFDIKKKMISYHEHNRFQMTPVLVERMINGEDIALVTDAGTPAISDPGEDLVKACIEAGVEVTSLPGATAFTTALTLSGMSARRFTFEGFLPKEKNEIASVLDRLKSTTLTTIFYEAPHRLTKTLKLISSAIESVEAVTSDENSFPEKNTHPNDRSVTICRELTKKHEWTRHFDSVRSAYEYFTETEEPRGEFVLVIEGRDETTLKAIEQASWNEMSIEEHMKIYLSKGIEKKEAMRLVAHDRGVSKRDIYKALI